MARPTLSLVMPAYNEAGNIERAVRAAAAAGAQTGTYEVVVVDDGSRDATAERLAALEAEMGARLRVVRHEKNRGYGAALRSGFAAAEGDLVFYTDSDNQFDLSELASVIPLMQEWDAVLGYRIDRKDARRRLMTSWVFNRLSCIVFDLRVRDLNCSFKLFRRDVLRALPLESDDFFIDTELVVRLHRAGFRYVERGVTHLPRLAGRSTVRLSDIPRTLAAVARMWAKIKSEPATLNGGSLRLAGALLVATAAAATTAYQVMRPVVVDLGSALAVPLSMRGLYPAEEGYRWTNGQGEIALPSPGRGRAIRLDMVVSAWRPRGTPAPQLRITAEGASVVAEPGPAPVALTLLADTSPSMRAGMERPRRFGELHPRSWGSTDPRGSRAPGAALARGWCPATRPAAVVAGLVGAGRGAAPVLDRREDRRRSRTRAFSAPASWPLLSSRSGSPSHARGPCGSCPRPRCPKACCCWSSPSSRNTSGRSRA